MLGLLRSLETRPTQLRRLVYASGTALLLGLAVVLTPSAAVPAAAQGYGIYGGQCSLAYTCQQSPYYNTTDTTHYYYLNYQNPTSYYFQSNNQTYPYYNSTNYYQPYNNSYGYGGYGGYPSYGIYNN